jgi:hypothetical protein
MATLREMADFFAELASRQGLRRITRRSRAPREKVIDSPYFGRPSGDWSAVTASLIAEHPLEPEDIVTIVRKSWDAIFTSRIGPAEIGRDIFPTPQIMGFLIHELIPLEFEQLLPGSWRAGRKAGEKDLVCAADDRCSIEIKTSSHERQIFANRSYGQEQESEGKKAKAGYYIAVNFTAWEYDDNDNPNLETRPEIRMIRFGWLDHTDWVAQKSETGQQSSLPPLIENAQLLRLFPD